MADITTTHKTLDLRAAAPAVAPVAAGDADATPAAEAKPATQLHQRLAGDRGVLDLRSQSQPVVAPVAAAPTPAVSGDAPVAITPATPQSITQAAPTPVPGQVVMPPTPPSDEATTTPLAPARSPLSPALPPAKLAGPPRPLASPGTAVSTPPAPPLAAPLSVVPPAPPPPSPKPQSPLINKFPGQPAATQAALQTAAIAGSHVDAMSVQAATAPAPPAPPQSPALQQALAAAKQSSATSSMIRVAAAVAVIGLMAGIVWLQNSPKLAFHNAATQAGIDATLPTYIPSNYHQDGPVVASVGELIQRFTSPDATPLSIKQRQTSWDSSSLRDNYVSQQTTSYLAIQGQGLTIYLFNNEADWVNHGVWYQITGIGKLSRDQVLQIAYGL